MATSELADRLAANLRKPQGRVSEIYGQRLTAITIDTELQEVREVLEELRDSSVNADCWCAYMLEDPQAHTEACQRARKLYERLRIERE